MHADDQLRLTLYYNSGHEPSRLAEERLRLALEGAGHAEYELEMVDLAIEPQRAEQDRVLACPTIIKRSPGPIRRIIGDLSAVDVLQDAIGLA